MAVGDQIRIGGLMRCCIDTIGHNETPGKEGDTLQCMHAPNNPDHRMRFRDGAWEWDHEPTVFGKK